MMVSDDIKQIKIDKHRMGIIGLKQILEEVAPEFADRSDNEVEAELLRRLSQQNYIPGSVKSDYGRAFLGDFKKFTGQPFDDSDPDGLEIKILGSGCARCNQLTQDLIAVMIAMNLHADIKHVTDVHEIGI